MIGGKANIEEVRGAGKIVETQFQQMENNEIRTYMERYMSNIFALLAGQNTVKPSIVLMDGNHISYEKDAAQTGETNRSVIRRQLTGQLGEPEPNIYEIGTHIGWNRWQDVITLNPDVAVVHWSAFERDGFDLNKQKLSCHPDMKNRCADRIMNGFRQMIKSIEGNKALRIIIYSRSRWLCDDFKKLLKNRIPPSEKYMYQRIALLSMDKDLRGASFNNSYAVDDLKNLLLHMLGKPNSYKNDPQNGICTLG